MGRWAGSCFAQLWADRYAVRPFEPRSSFEAVSRGVLGVPTKHSIAMLTCVSCEVLRERTALLALQEISISFQCNPNELAASPHFGLRE